MRVRLVLLAGLVAMLGASGPTQALRYNVTDLGPGGAYGIAVTGEVVGFTYAATGYQHACLWRNGTMMELGGLGGDWSVAACVNQHGQIVGGATTLDGEEHAFLWQEGVMRDLSTTGELLTVANCVNDSGRVVGSTQRAWLWEDGSVTHLGALPGHSESTGLAVSDSGRVVGFSMAPFDYLNQRAFLWQNGIMADLGTLGGAWSCAYDLDDSGWIVGAAQASDGLHYATLWCNGTIASLGTLPGCESSSASSVNTCGQIVGSAYTGSGGSRAFLWQDGVMAELDALPGGGSTYAKGIDNHGWVCGSCVGADGQMHAVLWAPVPEPSSLAALSLGLLAAGAGVKCRRRA